MATGEIVGQDCGKARTEEEDWPRRGRGGGDPFALSFAMSRQLNKKVRIIKYRVDFVLYCLDVKIGEVGGGTFCGWCEGGLIRRTYVCFPLLQARLEVGG